MTAMRNSFIGDQLSSRHNSLNFLRLLLALIVIVSHAITLGGYGDEGILHGTTLGTVAVYGFFGISGYLIATSAARNPGGRYLWQRFLRIFPGLWVCLIVTAFVIGVVAWVSQPSVAHCGLSCYFKAPQSPFSYLYRNWLLPNAYSAQFAIAGSPRGVPNPLIWDGQLWTLFYEFLCYLILGTLAVLGLLRRRSWTLVAAAVLWLSVVVITVTPSLDRQFSYFQNSVAMNLMKFAAIFLVGAVIFLYRERVPDSGWLALGCSVVFLAGLWLPGKYPDLTFTVSDLLTPLVAYPLLWLGIHLPCQRIGARNDYSYGIYIYGYPVAQLLAIWGVWRWGYVPFLTLSVLATIPFAVGSWWLIEKRALSLKKVDLKVASRWVFGSNHDTNPRAKHEV